MNAAIEQFRQAICNAGLSAPDTLIDDGAIHRFSTNGKPTHKNGWYMLHTDGIAAGAFGDWREGFTKNWCSKADTSMTEVERFPAQNAGGVNLFRKIGIATNGTLKTNSCRSSSVCKDV